jgi:hypothetical protein
VAVEPNQVTNVAGFPVPAGALGTFRVDTPVYRVTTADDSGPGSLRAVLAATNAHPGADTIVFSEVFTVPRTITLTSGQLAVTDAVTVAGPGATLLTVSGNNASRIFKVADAQTIINVAFSGMTLANGKNTEAAFITGGGAIYDGDDNLTLSDMVIRDCVGGTLGGGVYVAAPVSQLTFQRCTFANNSADEGGGLDVARVGTMTIDGCTFSDNRATNGEGGGFAVNKADRTFTGGSFTLRNSTLSGNSARSGGGGLLVYFATVNVSNCTISGNASLEAGSGSGGGLFIGTGSPSSAVTIRIANSTITGNTALASTTSGGLYINRGNPAAAVTVTSSIISGNRAPSTPDILAGAVTLVASAIGDPRGFSLAAGSGNNLPFGTDLKLGPLAANGGPTKTHALLPGSPAIDAGANPTGLAFDQRGSGFPRTVGAGTDIGAYESPFTPPTASGSFANVTTFGANSYYFLVTYRDPYGIAATWLGSGDVRVSGPNGFSALADFIGQAPESTATATRALYRLVPPGSDWDGMDNGTYTVSVEPRQVFNTAGVAAPAGPLGTFGVDVATFRVLNDADSGPGSLRAAVAGTNAHAGADTIVFDSAFFNGSRTITLTSGPLAITDSVTVTGSGAGLLTVSGNNASRIFAVDGPGILAVVISGLTLTGGRSAGSDLETDVGGAVYNRDENLTLAGCVFTNNSAVTGGGAVGMAYAGTLTMTDCTLSANSTQRQGGAIRVVGGGTADIRNCTIAGNTATFWGGGVSLGGITSNLSLTGCRVTGNVTSVADGGGIDAEFVTLNECTVNGNTAAVNGGGLHGNYLTVRNSTISNNVAGGGGLVGVGGGIAVNNRLTLSGSSVFNNGAIRDGGGVGFRGSLTDVNLISNSTIANNRVTDPSVGRGGGVFIPNGSGAVTVQNSTIAGNSAAARNGGGGIYSELASIINAQPGLAISSSVVASNTATGAPDIRADRIVVTFSAVGSQDGFTYPLSAGHNLPPGTDLKLGPLADNGGPTPTIALLPGSPAIDAGSNTGNLATDQRGFARVVGSAADIGAFEVQAPSLRSAVVNGGDAGTAPDRLFGDADGNRTVNVIDLTLFRNLFGTITADPTFDVNGDGVIDSADLAAFRANFGAVI